MTTKSPLPKRGIIITFTILITGIAVSLWIQHMSKRAAVSPTLAFIEHNMTNPNGTLATYLKEAPSANPDYVAGHEALSESLGVWMQIALLNRDEQRFQQSYDLLRERYLSPQNYIKWKLQPDGTSEVNTNALGDDLRIVRALLEGYDLWQQTAYLAAAEAITARLQQSSMLEGYFVDYHDFLHQQSADVLSLVYVDTLALQAMERHGLIDRSVLDRHLELLQQLPAASQKIFYPQKYEVGVSKYTSDDKVNLIDQLIVAIHVAELGQSPQELIHFLKQELKNRGKLFGQYDRSSRQPAVDYESPSVYGLAILLALETRDQAWAEELYPLMLAMRDHNPRYKGGYVFDGDTHLFDNLFPLLAEVSLKGH
ncbi:glycosyl hydrolase [Paenibacillus sp. NPDC058174]|uniref:glycosyl hydrolase n=1 Tax=Paenibacillus sp. NPDC058174 TaxID=3346366 RepID=UPI0036D7E250